MVFVGFHQEKQQQSSDNSALYLVILYEHRSVHYHKMEQRLAHFFFCQSQLCPARCRHASRTLIFFYLSNNFVPCSLPLLS
jgi:hypothetical protein